MSDAPHAPPRAPAGEPPGRASEMGLRRLEHGGLARWVAAIAVMLALALTVVTLYAAGGWSAPPDETRRVLSIGLFGLILIFSLYMLFKEGETRRLRARLLQARLAEERLARDREAAVETARLKSEFLSNMSHELRTPMTGIVGVTELLLGTELSAEQREFLETSKGCADALLVVINDILDYSKIEAQKLELEAIPFRLRECMRSATEPLVPRAARKGLELTWHVAAQAPDQLVGDPGRLRQILFNLIGNAIKFTDRGAVAVRVALESETDLGVILRVSVTDTGIGIPSQRQGSIFAAFTQVDASATREHGGTGLGLAIAAELVEMMGGRIGVDSEPGRGSTFWFTARLGLEPRAVLDTGPVPAVDLHDRSILVVDADATSRRVFAQILEGWRIRATAVSDAPSALAGLRNASTAGIPFDLVLLDSVMPGTDGLALATAMKSDPALRRTPIIVLTSAAQPGDARRCRELGVTGYLPKPILGSDLLEAIRAVLAGEWADVGQRPLVTRHWLRENRHRFRLALLTPDPALRETLAQALRRRGHHVVALAEARDLDAMLEREVADLVLVDLDDLGPAGRVALAGARGSAMAPRPVIGLGGEGSARGEAEAAGAGVDARVPKPVDLDRLFAAVDLVLSARAPDPSEMAAG
ncbi:MAG TPA: ATP-binding protein [Candidatus Eisenbacteria bacterium]